MRLQVKGKNVEVSDSIRRYAEDKLHKLDRQLHELTQVELELRVEKNPSISANQVAEATIWTKGPTLRAREASTDMKASIDQLTEKLLRQVEHYRAKPLHERLAEEGGLVDRRAGPLFTGVIPETGIHGVARERQYEAVVTTEAPDVEGASARFVGLEDGSLLIEEGEGDLTALADA